MDKEELEKLKEKLLRPTDPHKTSQETFELACGFCEDYKRFLDAAKTEREAAGFAEELAREAGFLPFERGKKYSAGERVYKVNRGKAIILAVIGEKPVEQGTRISAAHIDSPRLDLKQNPLYESDELAYFKTHYYGGIKKYQWTTIPLELHGVVCKKDGTTVQVKIGDDESEPVLCVTDLLPHLASEQSKKSLGEAIPGEKLNLLIGSRPLDAEKGSDLVKLNIMRILNERYDITESDFLSAELEAVPAGKARDLGLDRSMILAYGHDDRVCAYPALRAVMESTHPMYTAVTVLTDKEEIGSEGNTGLRSQYLRNFILDLALSQGGNGRNALSNSKCLSADVNAAYDPNFSDQYEKRNACYAGRGVCLTKVLGVRGKAGSSDASAEFIAECRALFDGNGVIWQTGELGKVDAGGGGTVAKFIAEYDVDTVDVGVPVLSMHAPYEVVSKLDVYMAYRAFSAFFGNR